MAVVDIAFRATGSVIPADHGYALFAALSRILPDLHEAEDVGLHPISGWPSSGRLLTLVRSSSVTFRVPHAWYARLLPLTGQELDLRGHRLRLGVPKVYPLRPAPSLYSRLVTIKSYTEPTTFLERARQQLNELGVEGKISLIPRPLARRPVEGRVGSRSPYLRRTVEIDGRVIVGFALKVTSLSPEASISLQSSGLGGRRHMGCGIFVPATGDVA